MSSLGKSLRVALVAGLMVAPLAYFSSAGSHTGATGIVKERMMLMDELAKAMKALKQLIAAPGAPTPAARPEIARNASIIEGHAVKMLKLFPKGTDKHPSEALPSIWSDWRGFEKSANSLVAAARVLKSSSEKSDRATLLKAFIGVARTCGSCHASYRKKQR